jgi:4-hydroxyphenylpyruvate dioxygenase
MACRFIPGIATQSLGNAAHHCLPKKLSLSASHGFQGIELFFEDLESTARSLPSSYPPGLAGSTFSGSTPWQEQLLAAATYVSDLCEQLRLEIICLQPFMHYGGIIDRERHAQRIEEMRFWILLAQRLGTDLIQVPSSFLSESECTRDVEVVARDMREIADLGLQQTPPIRFCYEALAWGTQVDLWDQAWQVVKLVDRPNFGTCLDTFNLCGRVYADPASPNGINTNAERDMQRSFKRLREELDPKKVFYVEAVDGERLDQPLNEQHPWHVDGQPPRMTWSRNARLFPLEKKGYLPVIETLQAILDTGYEGYISFEFFSRTANDPHPAVPEQHAKRAQESWRKLSEKMGWDQADEPASELSKQDAHYQLSSQPQPKGQQPLLSPTIYEAATPRVRTSMLEAH